MNTTITILIIALIITVIVATVIIISQIKKYTQAPEDEQSLMLLQNQINQLTQEVNRKLENTQNTLQKQFGDNTKLIRNLNKDSNKTIKEVTEKLTKLDETNKRVVEFATQLQSLENILKNPKQRGVLGEYFLETLLSKVMPQGTYKMQYKFSDGEMVDAALIVKDKVIPIDSKFSLEKYNEIQEETNSDKRESLEKEFKSDLKKRIDETAKYIRPTENTTDFALMFIPAEGIFYDLLMYKVGSLEVSSEDLINYAFKKGVVLVSPNTFYAYLQTILQALNSLQVEESVKDIIKGVNKLGKHLTNYKKQLELLGSNLNRTVGSYNRASHQFRQIDKDIVKISGDGIDYEKAKLERPDTDDK